MYGSMMLEADYFADNPTHTHEDFWRRFRMNKELFMRIVYGVREYDDYFKCKKDTTGLVRLFSVQNERPPSCLLHMELP
jgi:hypothetical protein